MLHLSAKRGFAIFTLQGTTGDSLGTLLVYLNIRKIQEEICWRSAQKSAADFMQIDGMDIIYIIVYNSWTTTMPLRGRTSPIAPFLDQDVILYARSFYSVIHISYSLIIHCFNGKEI